METGTARQNGKRRHAPGFGRALRAGDLVFDSDAGMLHVVADRQPLHSFAFASLTPTQWGSVYERHVGLWFEATGYAVTYRGLQLGFLDSGVDLVLEKDGETIYVQCKYALGQPLGLSRIRWLMHKADAFLAKQYQGRPLHFHLVVPDKERCFSSTKSKINGNVKKHSVARYFEEHNALQNRVRLKVIEVPMPLVPSEKGIDNE